MYAPVVRHISLAYERDVHRDTFQIGPVNPNMTQQQRSFKNLLNGHAESTTLSDFQFENQRRTFDSFGYAADPSVGEHATPQMIGNQTSAEINQGITIFEAKHKRVGDKRKKEKNTNSDDVEGFQGPWAPYVDEVTVSRPSEVGYFPCVFALLFTSTSLFDYRKIRRRSTNIWPRERKRNDPILTTVRRTRLVILNRLLSTKSMRIRRQQHCTSKIRMIIKVDPFFIFHTMSVLIYVLITHRNDASFRSNASIPTRATRKVFKRSITFRSLLISSSRVRWIAKSK